MPNFPLFPDQASSLAGQVDALFLAWVGISIFFTILIFVAVLFFFVRYRQRHEGETGKREGATWPLEVTWSVIPLIITLVMFAWGTKVFFSISRPPANAVEYFVTGKQWMWKIQHPEGVREINTLHVPAGVPIKLTMTSEDVIHSFFLPSFRVKADVLPGRYTTVWFKATKPGRYHIFCAEYCGAEHSKMGGSVYVMEPQDYQAWLSGGIQDQPPAELGAQLFASLACDTCHMAGDRNRGPHLENVFGSEVALTSGRTVTVDEGYIRESILNPQAKLVAGYPPLMPTYQGQVTEEQIGHLIAYIKSLTSEAAANATTAPAS